MKPFSGALLPVTLALGLTGCGGVPLSTQFKLRSFDPLTFDPMVPRASVLITDRLRVPAGKARLAFSYWRKDAPQNRTTEEFLLQEVNEPAPDPLPQIRGDDERIIIFRLAPQDAARVRALQAQFAVWRMAEPNAHAAELTTDVSACHTIPLPAGPVTSTLYIKFDTANGYLPFFQGVDLRDLARSAGKSLDDEIKPCPLPSKRQSG